MKSIMTVFTTLIVAALSLPAMADVQVPAKPMHVDESVHCIETTVTKVSYYFAGQPASGIFVAFAANLGVARFPKAHASVADRQSYIADYQRGWVPSAALSGGAPNPVMMQERVGDHVQVCLVSVPIPQGRCDPDTDPRGRVYRVYDYRQHAAYVEMNDGHGCGGA